MCGNSVLSLEAHPLDVVAGGWDVAAMLVLTVRISELVLVNK